MSRSQSRCKFIRNFSIGTVAVSTTRVAASQREHNANEAWRDGAETTMPRRKAVVRPAQMVMHAYHIYRSFNFGNLLSLHMLDKRVIGRARLQKLFSDCQSSAGCRGDGTADQAAAIR